MSFPVPHLFIHSLFFILTPKSEVFKLTVAQRIKNFSAFLSPIAVFTVSRCIPCLDSEEFSPAVTPYLSETRFNTIVPPATRYKVTHASHFVKNYLKCYCPYVHCSFTLSCMFSLLRRRVSGYRTIFRSTSPVPYYYTVINTVGCETWSLEIKGEA
jgi:hypothetical protein